MCVCVSLVMAKLERSDDSVGGDRTPVAIFAASDSMSTFALSLQKILPPCELITPQRLQTERDQGVRNASPSISCVVLVFDHQISSNFDQPDIRNFRLYTCTEAQKLKARVNNNVVIVLDETSPFDLVQFDAVLAKSTNVIPSNLGVLGVSQYINTLLEEGQSQHGRYGCDSITFLLSGTET